MLSTREIMEIALKLANFELVPADSTIYVEGKNIKKILFGIDADVSELLLAKQLGYDAVISHHPKGGLAVVDFHRVFSRHVQQMIAAGIPKREADEAVRKKMKALEVEMHTRNYGHTVDVARLLKMPYMNIHTPLDEIGRRIMARKVQRETGKDATVGDVVLSLKKLPEFRNATTNIEIRLGNTANPAGKTIVSHGAGTNGGYEIARTYFKYGINTLIYIHISPADLEKLRADRVGNLIITGHTASDSVGINPFIKELENRDILVTKLGIVPP
jgi:putative NIF3 family GTP cyclohydrolase 1 type 2